MERDVKHGCCSCAYYKYPTTKAPCKTCVKWSNWVDAASVPQEGEAQ